MSFGLTRQRWRFTSTFGSPGEGSITAVLSSTAVTQTRRPSSSAGKSGRITTSLSVAILSSGMSSSVAASDMTGMISQSLPSGEDLLSDGAPLVGSRRGGSAFGGVGLLALGAGSPAVLERQPEQGRRDQQQQEEREEVGGEEPEQVAAVAAEQPADLQEDEGPDRGGHEHAGHEHDGPHLEDAGEGGQHDPHTGDVPSDDDGRGPPALEGTLRLLQPLRIESDGTPAADQEGVSEPPADAVKAEAAQHRSAHHRQVRRRVGEGPRRGQVAAPGDDDVARRRKWDSQLLGEDGQEQPERLVLAHEVAQIPCQRLEPGGRLRPALEAGLNDDENVEHSCLTHPKPLTGPDQGAAAARGIRPTAAIRLAAGCFL